MFKTFATAAVLTVSFAGTAMAEDVSNISFRAATPDSQKSYITTSFAMAVAIVTPAQAKCISQIRGDVTYSEIVQAIDKHRDFHPSGVIAAYIEKKCGTFEVAKN